MFNKKEIEELKEKVKKLEEEKEQLKESYGLSKSKELKDENNILNNKIKNLNDTNNSQTEIIKELQRKLGNEINKNKDLEYYKETVKDLNEQNKELEEQLSIANSNKELNELRLDKLKQELAVKDKEIQAYVQAINNVSLTFQGIEKSKTTKKVKGNK